jgi:hypothetical protein
VFCGQPESALHMFLLCRLLVWLGALSRILSLWSFVVCACFCQAMYIWFNCSWRASLFYCHGDNMLPYLGGT